MRPAATLRKRTGKTCAQAWQDDGAAVQVELDAEVRFGQHRWQPRLKQNAWRVVAKKAVGKFDQIRFRTLETQHTAPHASRGQLSRSCTRLARIEHGHCRGPTEQAAGEESKTPCAQHRERGAARRGGGKRE